MKCTKKILKISTLGIAIISIFAFSCVSYELTEPVESLTWDIDGMYFVQTLESNQGWTEDFTILFTEISENVYVIYATQDTYYGSTHDQRIYILESVTTSENQILCQKIEFTHQTREKSGENFTDFYVINEESNDFTGEATDIFIFDSSGDGSATWRSKSLTMDIPLVAQAEPRPETTKRPATDYEDPLFNAVASGNIEEVKNLLQGGANINMRLRELAGQTPLITALFENQIEVAEFLIDSGADISISRADGQTALMTAAYLGQAAIVEKLVSSGADVNTVKEGGFTPLLIGAEGGSTEVCRILLEAGADTEAVSEGGWTTLMRACYDENIELVGLLIDYGTDVNYQEPNEHMTALMFGAMYNNIFIVKILIAEGADLNVEGKFGTALEIAKEGDKGGPYQELVDILTQAGAR